MGNGGWERHVGGSPRLYAGVLQHLHDRPRLALELRKRPPRAQVLEHSPRAVGRHPKLQQKLLQRRPLPVLSASASSSSSAPAAARCAICADARSGGTAGWWTHAALAPLYYSCPRAKHFREPTLTSRAPPRPTDASPTASPAYDRHGSRHRLGHASMGQHHAHYPRRRHSPAGADASCSACAWVCAGNNPPLGRRGRLRFLAPSATMLRSRGSAAGGAVLSRAMSKRKEIIAVFVGRKLSWEQFNRIIITT